MQPRRTKAALPRHRRLLARQAGRRFPDLAIRQNRPRRALRAFKNFTISLQRRTPLIRSKQNRRTYFMEIQTTRSIQVFLVYTETRPSMHTPLYESRSMI